MTIKIDTKFLALTLIILLTEIAIAYYLKNGFIRFTVGDFLASILVYCGLKSIFKIHCIQASIWALAISFCIEFAQLTNLLDTLHLKHNKIASIVLGSHFSIADLVAYTLGIITIYFIDTNYITNENN
ncbi:DUF2809 domain-containing protein [Olleya sp. AS48]|jgi:hypothetical protein|uniref:ribosomal maturation YjgA family protein n=1 Tax=Olleya sp. AS48 TaxID=3135774 RepID=UPI0030D97ED2|tara:strand:+ start:47343 stop:47726 length:384 start_codon:yes stop_codon:yes gene_type:complete